MKLNDNINKNPSLIQEGDLKTLESCITEIELVIQAKVVNEDVVTKLGNLVTTFSSLRDNYMWRMLRAAKQNRMLD